MTMGITSPTSTTGQILKNGSAVISFDANNNATFSGNVAPSVNPTMRNRIINGAMVIDQRNAGAASTNAINGYFLDRWQVLQSTTGKIIAQQNAGSVTPPTGFTNYLGVTSQSAYTVGSSDYYMFQQCIEGFNTTDLGFGTANAKTLTLSFVVYSSLTGTFGGVIKNYASTRSYPFTYTISSANTWTTISITIAGDTSGTWAGATNSGSFIVNFGLGVGSTYSGTSGSWASANYISATGATSVVGTNGATLYITGVQLEVGSVATPFEQRLYGTELALCQRYFEMSYSQGTVPGTATNAGGQNAVGAGVNDVGTTSYYKATKRTSPTITVYSPSTGASGAIRNFNTGADITGVSTEVGDTGFRVYKAGAITAGQYYAYQYIASAEL